MGGSTVRPGDGPRPAPDPSASSRLAGMPNPGDLLMDRYRIVDHLGSGGMATVHRARDERLERTVAVKVLAPNLANDPQTATRFEREARSLAAAAHPGVVAVYDVDAGDPATGREPCFVMELCPGGSLSNRLAGGRRLAPDEIVPTLVSVADGLADLHRRGVVHRDVKPQNILFATDRAKLADFGLALDDGAPGAGELTTPGMAVGTLAYLAPEILAGERATPAADVYGLAVVAFLALTGELPRPSSSMAELVRNASSPARRVSTAAPDLGPAFDDVVGSGLALRPADRPDALDFASGLTMALGRWSRDGGPTRHVAAVGLPGASAGSAQGASTGSAPAGQEASNPGRADDTTTAIAIPLVGTSAFRVDDPASKRPGASAPDGERGGGPRPAAAAAIAVAILATLAGLYGLSRLNAAAPAVGLGPSPGPASLPPASQSPPSIAPSIAPSSPPPTQAPSIDPALAALDDMDAAISAARGGPDGLKGKEANDLEAGVSDVRQALGAGDRAAALDAARKLDHRVHDVAKDLDADRAERLRTASANLVRALGG